MAETCNSHVMPMSWQDESSDYTTLSSASMGSPSSSTPTTEANDEVSTASESELDSRQGSEAGDSEDDNDEKYSKKQHRRSPPPIFFGTPNKAEREKRKDYATQVRTRRLLRKDSLELTRRKSVGMDQGRESTSLNTFRLEGVTQVAPNASLHASNAIEDDISTLVLSDKESVLDLELENSSCSDNDTGDESSSEDSSEDGSVLAGDRTIRVQDALQKMHEDVIETQPPSTPIKQIMRPFISRPSLALSDADSSPGIALALHPSSTNRPSPFFRPSPASGSKSHQNESFSASNASPYNTVEFNNDILELEKERTVSSRRKVLQESPSRVNQAVSPSKTTHSSSPTKEVVRQTLSAWAHAKLKTPQSPEKKEWERKHAETASPICQPLVSSSMLSSMRENNVLTESLPSTTATQLLIASTPSLQAVPITSRIERPFPSNTSLRRAGQDQLNRPASRIARPIPPSRLPVPVQKAASASIASNGTAAKRMVLSNTAPTFRRIANTTNPSSLRPSGIANTNTLPIIRATPRPAHPSKSSGPFRPQSAHIRSLDRSSTVGPISSVSSSPAKIDPSTVMQRSAVQSSSPFKRVVTSSTPIVRDARLIAAPRLIAEALPEASSSSPSFSSSSPAVVSVILPSALDSSSTTSTFNQISTGVGAARRVVVSRENAQSSKEPRVKRTSEEERDHSEKRRIRIKEITMGKSTSLKKVPSSDGIDDPLPSELNANEAAVSPLTDNNDAQKMKVEYEGVPHSSRRKHEKRSNSGKPSKSPVFSSSLSKGNNGGIPLSKTELSRLTSLHTQRNEMFVSQLETIVIRKRGENRPSSPSSKIRKSISNGASVMTNEAAKEARKQRARKRTPDAFESEEEENLLSISQHQLGAGEEEIYNSPPRLIMHQSQQRVHWHKSLFCGPKEILPSSHLLKRTLATQNRKGCLRNRLIPLDHLGNVLETSPPLSPRLTKQKVTIYKLIYDDDEE